VASKVILRLFNVIATLLII